MVPAGKIAGVVGVVVVAVLVLAAAPVTAAQTPPAATPTFTKDVLPILQRSCQTCHRPGTHAPMSLMTYKDARPWVRSITQKVTRREMPPWHIDRIYFTFYVAINIIA